VILVDANVLMYASFSSFSQHRRAHAWLDHQLNTVARVGMPWESLLAFLRLSTNPRVLSQPLNTGQALAHIETWLSCPNVFIPQPTETHSVILAQLMRAANASGDLIPDAHLAAIALQHGLAVCSADRDFARFDGLNWINPLAN
jgi:toxin-antitoxin system PIN domain toxin